MKKNQNDNFDTNTDGVEQERRINVKSVCKEILIYVMIFALCLFFIPRYVCCKYTVQGISMQNTLQEKEQIIGEKISYRFTGPKRFDVVVVQPFEEEKDNYYVKRVIGLPGETIEIKGKNVYINGELLDDSKYIREEMLDSTYLEATKLGEDEYFVMGDNRNYSSDSRESEIGPIPFDRVIAKAFFIVWPLNKVSPI